MLNEFVTAFVLWSSPLHLPLLACLSFAHVSLILLPDQTEGPGPSFSNAGNASCPVSFGVSFGVFFGVFFGIFFLTIPRHLRAAGNNDDTFYS